MKSSKSRMEAKRYGNRGFSKIELTLAIIAAFAGAVHGGTMEQQLTLQPGWSAVYVGVSCNGAPDELFASWPVDHVSAYSAQAFRVTADSSSGLTGERVALSPFLAWTRAAPWGATLAAIPADTVLVCHNTNATAFATTLSGVPAPPRILWHSTVEGDTYNYIGVRLANGSSVKAADYFAGCPALSAGKDFYTVTSGAQGTMTVTGAGASFGRHASSEAMLTDGSVILAPGTTVSDWSGPLHVSPLDGADFGDTATLRTIEIRNDSPVAKLVSIDYLASSDGKAKPALLYRESATADSLSAWGGLENTLVRLVETGDVWRVTLALDRSRLAGTLAELGGVLHVYESDATLSGYTAFSAFMNVSAIDRKSACEWPQGLWCVNVALDAVSWQSSATKRVDGVKAGGRFNCKIFIHVDSSGEARLLQRVVVASTSPNDEPLLFAPGAALPSGMTFERRLSSAVLPVDLGAKAATSGAFADASAPLTFEYSIGPTSPSNPFNHALHPLFDNKQMDFATPAPDGDDPQNYVGAVKPERFTISASIALLFDPSIAASWNPKETLTGSCEWTYTGVRSEGPVKASGRFSATRVLPVNTIN